MFGYLCCPFVAFNQCPSSTLDQNHIYFLVHQINIKDSSVWILVPIEFSSLGMFILLRTPFPFKVCVLILCQPLHSNLSHFHLKSSHKFMLQRLRCLSTRKTTPFLQIREEKWRENNRESYLNRSKSWGWFGEEDLLGRCHHIFGEERRCHNSSPKCRRAVMPYQWSESVWVRT